MLVGASAEKKGAENMWLFQWIELRELGRRATDQRLQPSWALATRFLETAVWRGTHRILLQILPVS